MPPQTPSQMPPVQPVNNMGNGPINIGGQTPPPSNFTKNLVIIILIILILLAGAYIYMTKWGGSSNTSNLPVSGENTVNNTPVQNNVVKEVKLDKVTVSGIELSVADVTISDNRDQVTGVRMLVDPLGKAESRKWYVIMSLLKGGVKEAVCNPYNDSTYSYLNIESISSPTKVTINKNLCKWDPGHMLTGEYVLNVEILNPSTKESLANVQKNISMTLNAPTVQ
jgi:hypothetical protein